jgi:hypothetical protein
MANNKATVVNGVVSADIELRDNGILELEIWRNGKLVQRRALGPQVDYDD